jgi:hypothetical protein
MNQAAFIATLFTAAGVLVASATPAVASTRPAVLRAYVSACFVIASRTMETSFSVAASDARPYGGARSQGIRDLQAARQRCSADRVRQLLSGLGLSHAVASAAYSGVFYLELAAADLVQWYISNDYYNLQQAKVEYRSGVIYAQRALRNVR